MRREPALVVEGCNEREVGREGEKRHQKRASCGEKGEGEGGEETNDTKREEERDIVRKRVEEGSNERRVAVRKEPAPVVWWKRKGKGRQRGEHKERKDIKRKRKILREGSEERRVAIQESACAAKERKGKGRQRNREHILREHIHRDHIEGNWEGRQERACTSCGGEGEGKAAKQRKNTSREHYIEGRWRGEHKERKNI